MKNEDIELLTEEPTKEEKAITKKYKLARKKIKFKKNSKISYCIEELENTHNIKYNDKSGVKNDDQYKWKDCTIYKILTNENFSGEKLDFKEVKGLSGGTQRGYRGRAFRVYISSRAGRDCTCGGSN